MPRSATDATRFTSTVPHASAKPPQPKSNQPLKSSTTRRTTPGPVGETPQQKVKRLRAAADRAREAQVTTFDKIILRGRIWADRVHRVTALSLIGITVIAGGVTLYALGDMMIHNRKKRAEFFAEQKAQYSAKVFAARVAIGEGTATEEQLEFISQEDEKMSTVARQAMERAEKKGVFRRGKEWLLSGLKQEDDRSEGFGTSEKVLGHESLVEKGDKQDENPSGILTAIEESKTAVQQKAKQAFANEREKQRTGGALDRLGTREDTIGSEEDGAKSRSWTSFMTRR